MRLPRTRSPLRAASAAAMALFAALALVLPAAAAEPSFRPPTEGRLLYDTAGTLSRADRRAGQSLLASTERLTGARVVVYIAVESQAVGDRAAADALAESLLAEWQLETRDAAALVLALDEDPSRGTWGLAVSERFGAQHATVDHIRATSAQTSLDPFAGDGAAPAAVAIAAVVRFAYPQAAPSNPPATPDGAPSSAPPGGVSATGAPPAAGPPFPDPVDGQVVYDFADVLTPETEGDASGIITGIEERTGAEVVVYTQVKPESDTVEEAERDAIALMDQWGVGRRGFDDGLVILFDMDAAGGRHGQVQLYAGPGYRATFLSNDERQAIFETDMLPLLRGGDINGALRAALAKVDANATPEHAAALEQARRINAAIGIIGGPALLLLLVGWASSTWWRYGRDPVYLDDPSIHMPAPPPELTPAVGALIHEGRMSRRALTAAMIQLAARGEIRFLKQDRLLRDRVAVAVTEPDLDDPEVVRNQRKLPNGTAEAFALQRLAALARDEEGRLLEADELLRFGRSVDGFERRLEERVAEQGWFREPPSKATERWSYRGGVMIVAGVIGGVVALDLPSSGLLVVAGAAVAAGIVTVVVARVMPQRTMAGAMLFAMLAAYRRTLQKTMAQARSMGQVVREAGLPWLETPDQAVTWGVALGLHEEVEGVLERSLEDLRSGTASAGSAYVPTWWSSRADGAVAGGSGGLAPGLLSASALPDFGGMMAALSTVGDAPSSSGSGSGGFSGGSSGGGGGGAGGGF